LPDPPAPWAGVTGAVGWAGGTTGAVGWAGTDVEDGVPLVAGAVLECPCHRPTASTMKVTATAVPTTTAQMRNQDGPLPCWLVA
jgi:hypothetical protein